MINIRCQNLGVRLYWSVVRQHLTEGGLSPTRMKFKVKTSRSELHSRAIAEFIARHDDDAVTQALDEVARNINGRSLRYSDDHCLCVRHPATGGMVIQQGEIWWADLDADDCLTNTWLRSLPVLTSSWGGRLHKRGQSTFRFALVCLEVAVKTRGRAWHQCSDKIVVVAHGCCACCQTRTSSASSLPKVSSMKLRRTSSSEYSG